MLLRRLFYLAVFIFSGWLAIATRTHRNWFHPFIATYGGDVIWAGMFLFLLRALFIKTPLWKLALLCYTLGVLDEVLQLYHAGWIEAIRKTRIGGLLLGYGFLWSDIICYAAGTIIAWVLITVIEWSSDKSSIHPTQSGIGK